MVYKLLKEIKIFFILSAIAYILGVLVRILPNTPLVSLNSSFDNSIFIMHTFVPSNHTNFEVFYYIFKNNLILNLILSFSFFTFGFSNFILLFLNGFILGNQVMISINSSIPFFKIVILLLPHGIIELFALFLSSSLSFYILISLFRYVNNGVSLKKELFFNWFILFISIIIITLLSALVESFITISLLV